MAGKFLLRLASARCAARENESFSTRCLRTEGRVPDLSHGGTMRTVRSRACEAAITLAVVLATLGVLASNRAEALMQLRMDDGTQQITITDGGAGDFCGTAGCIVALASFTAFDVAVSTGLVNGALTISDM